MQTESLLQITVLHQHQGRLNCIQHPHITCQQEGAYLWEKGVVLGLGISCHSACLQLLAYREQGCHFPERICVCCVGLQGLQAQDRRFETSEFCEGDAAGQAMLQGGNFQQRSMHKTATGLSEQHYWSAHLPATLRTSSQYLYAELDLPLHISRLSRVRRRCSRLEQHSSGVSAERSDEIARPRRLQILSSMWEGVVNKLV